MNTTFSELLERFIPFVLDKSFIGKSYTIIAYDFQLNSLNNLITAVVDAEP